MVETSRHGSIGMYPKDKFDFRSALSALKSKPKIGSRISIRSRMPLILTRQCLNFTLSGITFALGDSSGFTCSKIGRIPSSSPNAPIVSVTKTSTGSPGASGATSPSDPACSKVILSDKPLAANTFFATSCMTGDCSTGYTCLAPRRAAMQLKRPAPVPTSSTTSPGRILANMASPYFSPRPRSLTMSKWSAIGSSPRGGSCLRACSCAVDVGSSCFMAGGCSCAGERSEWRSRLEHREERLSRMQRREAQRPLDLRAARVARGENAPAVALRVDLLFSRQLEDAQRIVLVRDLVAVHAAHSAASGLHDLEGNAERGEDFRPLRRRFGGERLLRAMRQQAKSLRADRNMQRQTLLDQPLLQEPHAEARIALELFRVFVAVRENHGRLDTDQRKAERGNAAQEVGIACNHPAERTQKAFDVQRFAVLEIRQHVRLEAQSAKEQARSLEHPGLVEGRESVLEHNDHPCVFRKALQRGEARHRDPVLREALYGGPGGEPRCVGDADYPRGQPATERVVHQRVRRARCGCHER